MMQPLFLYFLPFPETPCQYSMDLVFIVDKSGSIDDEEFEIAKEFVARVVCKANFFLIIWSFTGVVVFACDRITGI